jgi:microcystin-dependent protein
MGTPFMSEIRIMSFNFAPQGWAQCNGQLLPINQNQALFSLLGTMYGGNGQTNFALPNLRGQVPAHIGGGFKVQGETAGQETHTLSIAEIPTHAHVWNAVNIPATTSNSNANVTLSQSVQSNLYSAPSNLQAMAPNMVGNTGGSQAHENRQPYLTLNFCIALQGVFPSRN